jgi:NADPH-dependent 2,4-dienoyl-CoA reductase/sulfur reductase-like enzyme
MSARYVIIGMGVAGIAAVEGIRKVDPSGEITVIGDDPHGFYSRPGLAYYLTGEVEGEHLFPYPPDELHKLNARFLRGRVSSVLPAEGTLALASGGTLPYDRLLIATGAKALKLDTPGSELTGVVKLDNYDDARAILAAAKKSRRVVVVGGGITALELAEGLAARRVKVHYLMRGDRYWGNVLDETESRIVECRLRHEGIAIHYHSQLAEIIGKNGRVAGVRLADGSQIRCEMVAAAIGIAPRLDLARACGLRLDRGILTDEFLETSIPGIFAAGDVAEVLDPETGRRVLDSLWNSAREQGFAAGMNMAGARVPYLKKIPFNVTRLAGLTTTIIGMVGGGRDEDVIGIARGDSESWRQAPEASMAQTGFDVNRVRLMVGRERLLGGIVIGDQGISRTLEAMIREHVDITAIRARLMEPGAPIAEIIASFQADLAAGAVAATAAD